MAQWLSLLTERLSLDTVYLGSVFESLEVIG